MEWGGGGTGEGAGRMGRGGGKGARTIGIPLVPMGGGGGGVRRVGIQKKRFCNKMTPVLLMLSCFFYFCLICIL
jgi:hypothetical protein